MVIVAQLVVKSSKKKSRTFGNVYDYFHFKDIELL